VVFEELAEGLVHAGHEVRFVDHNENPLQLHVCLLEVLTEHDVNTVLEGGTVPLLHILTDLAEKLEFVGAAENVDVIDEPFGEHLANQELVGAGFSGLESGTEETVTLALSKLFADLEGGALLILESEGHCSGEPDTDYEAPRPFKFFHEKNGLLTIACFLVGFLKCVSIVSV
jgi:hypothetical protein